MYMFREGNCAREKYICVRRSASSPSCAVWATTPTTSIHFTGGFVVSSNVIRLPIGSLFGQ